MKILLLGVGMQGKAALHDLVASDAVEEIVAADLETGALTEFVEARGYAPKVRCEHLDASRRESVDRLMRERPRVAIDLLPVAFIDTVAEAAVRHGVHVVNSSYTTRGIERLADEAEARGVAILPELGMDPGIDLVMLAEAVRPFDRVTDVLSYGGGVPVPEDADNPLKYKVSWTLEGVLRSYRRPGRLLREGTVVQIGDRDQFRPENVHEVRIDDLGTMEAFPNGDALQYVSALGLVDPNLRNVGRFALRWPGHSAFWRVLVDLRLLDEGTVTVDGTEVDRRRFLAASLEPELRYGPGERDLAILRVEVVGQRGSRRERAVFQVVDRRDLVTGLTAVSRLVGFAVSIGAEMLGTGVIERRGLLSPLTDVPFGPFSAALAERGVRIEREVTRVRWVE